MIQLKDKETQNLEQIRKLKSDFETANKAVKPNEISTYWVQVVTKSWKNPRKSSEQIAVTNKTINQLNEREKRKKYLVIYDVTESMKSIFIKRRAEDEKKLKKFLNSLGNLRLFRLIHEGRNLKMLTSLVRF